ncbi:MAG: hypothetical protein QOG69_1649, partial [Actinomycetota bacterium]|nr:hypothetical protein [Actinomycetota bacterium]
SRRANRDSGLDRVEARKRATRVEKRDRRRRRDIACRPGRSRPAHDGTGTHQDQRANNCRPQKSGPCPMQAHGHPFLLSLYETRRAAGWPTPTDHRLHSAANTAVDRRISQARAVGGDRVRPAATYPQARYGVVVASAVTRFAASGVPSPVAASHPGPAAYPVTPFHEVSPTVMSWNVEAYAGVP